MNTSRLVQPFSVWAFVLFFALALGNAIVFDTKIAIVFASLPMFSWIVLRRPSYVLYFLIFILPFQSFPIFSQNIAGITGAKPVNIIAAGALAVLFLREGNIFRFSDEIEKKTFVFGAAYFLFFSIAFFRSLDNLSLFHMLNPEQFQNSSVNYILSFYVKPSLYLIAPLIIIKLFRSVQDLKRLIDVLLFSTTLLAIIVLTLLLAHWGDLYGGRGVVRQLCSDYLGMHYNTVGTVFLIIGPLLVVKALETGIFWKGCFFLTVSAILILQSRSAIFSFCLSSIFLLWVLRKKQVLMYFLVIIVPLLFAYIPDFISRGVTTGFEQGNMDAMLLGRVNYLWIPLLHEWFGDFRKFLFGEGLYGIMTSPRWASGYLVQAAHAHNAFINFFINNGIILLVVFTFYIVRFVRQAWKGCKEINTPICWALFMSVIAYLSGSMTERTIYPQYDNILLFPVIAMLINFFRIHHQNRKYPRTFQGK